MWCLGKSQNLVHEIWKKLPWEAAVPSHNCVHVHTEGQLSFLPSAGLNISHTVYCTTRHPMHPYISLARKKCINWVKSARYSHSYSWVNSASCPRWDCKIKKLEKSKKFLKTRRSSRGSIAVVGAVVVIEV